MVPVPTRLKLEGTKTAFIDQIIDQSDPERRFRKKGQATRKMLYDNELRKLGGSAVPLLMRSIVTPSFNTTCGNSTASLCCNES